MSNHPNRSDLIAAAIVGCIIGGIVLLTLVYVDESWPPCCADGPDNQDESWPPSRVIDEDINEPGCSRPPTSNAGRVQRER